MLDKDPMGEPLSDEEIEQAQGGGEASGPEEVAMFRTEQDDEYPPRDGGHAV